MIANIKKSLANRTVDGKNERGDIVQTIIIIAIFVGLAVVVFNLVAPSINQAANNTANCIKQSTSVDSGTGNQRIRC